MSAYFLCSYLNQFHFAVVFIADSICSKLKFRIYSYVVIASEFSRVSPSGVTVPCSPPVSVMLMCGNHTDVMAGRAFFSAVKNGRLRCNTFPSREW